MRRGHAQAVPIWLIVLLLRIAHSLGSTALGLLPLPPSFFVVAAGKATEVDSNWPNVRCGAINTTSHNEAADRTESMVCGEPPPPADSHTFGKSAEYADNLKRLRLFLLMRGNWLFAINFPKASPKGRKQWHSLVGTGTECRNVNADDPNRTAQITRLLMRHRHSLFGYILACVRNTSDAEDILQNVSVVVVESIGKLTSEEGFLPWAREIARRCILSYRRQSNREQVIDPELVQRLAETADRLERSEPASRHQLALQMCLEKLSPENRQLIALRYNGSIRDLSQLAERFGRSVQGIYALIKRIKASLRECVERRLAAEAER